MKTQLPLERERTRGTGYHMPTLNPIISARASDPRTRCSADFLTKSARANPSDSCQPIAVAERAAIMLPRISKAFSVSPKSPFPRSSKTLNPARTSRGSHLCSSSVMSPRPSSNCQRTKPLRKRDTSRWIASRDSMLAGMRSMADEMVSATAALSRTSLASRRACLSCISTSSCCFRFERFNTATATQAATPAETTAPSAPDQSWTQTPSSIPHKSPRTIPRNMGLSLRESAS